MNRPKPLYPPTWRAFSHHIRFERAMGQCECTGQCGLHRTHPGPRRCLEQHGHRARWARGIVILTVAHLCDCDPLCALTTHVGAFCQKCHLLTDMALHHKHAAETRRLSKELLGQIHLPFIESLANPRR